MTTPPDVDALWARFKGGDESARGQLMETYYGLVRAVAAGQPDRTDLDREDLVGLGVIGLNDALERFDPSRGLKFESYAWKRIAGAIRDEVQGVEWAEKRVHRRIAHVARIRSILEGRLGRTPTLSEIATEIGATVSWVERQLKMEERIKVSYLDAPRTGTVGRLVDGLMDSSTDSPENAFDAEEMRLRLADAIGSLCRQHRVILALRYREKLELQQLAVVIGVKTTRASQLRDEAIEALRSALAGHHVDAFLGGS